MHLLQVNAISKKNDKGFHLRGISFTQQLHQRIAIVGETGSGKSTLLKIIAGLEQPDAGEVIFKSERIVGPADKLIPGHKGIAYLSQDFRLPHFLRVEQILEYANEWPEDKAERLFTICRIRHLFKRRTDELSGGEQQRIAIARLLITDPSLFVLDEPFSNMDPANKNLLRNIIDDISQELKMSFILASHEPGDTIPWADRMFVLRDGQIIEEGTAVQLYSRPVFGYTAALLGSYNVISNELLHASNLHVDIAPVGMHAFVRPENCYLQRVRNQEVSGEAQQLVDLPGPANKTKVEQQYLEYAGKIIMVRYFGHYYEADVLTGNSRLICRSSGFSHKIGDLVAIKILRRDLHFVKD